MHVLHATGPLHRIKSWATAFILVKAAFVPGLARAATLPPVAEMVVKVISSPCSSTVQFKGSGLLFSRGGERYVLTSEHVVLHGNQGLCHSVELGSTLAAKAELIAADWGFGLALLRLAPEANAGMTGAPWTSLRAAVPAAGSPVLLAGYPARLAHQPPFIDPSASFASADSDGHLFPLVSTVAEVLGHGEFGMSGGDVLTADGAQLVGVLSHQFIRIVPGKPSTIAVFGDNTSEVENHLIVIPAATALQWVEQVLEADAGEGYRPVFERDVQDQLSDLDAVRVGGMRFALTKVPADNAAGGDGGIGGMDGVGVGGMDGVGVGGGAQATFADSPINVTLSDPADMGAWPFPELNGWALRLRQQLQVARELDVVHLVLQGVRLRYSSLAGFFRNVSLGAKPVVLRPQSTGDTARDGVLGRLQSLGEQAVEASQALSGKNVSASERQLLQKASVLGQILAARDWEVLNLSDLTAIRVDPLWSSLFVADFDEALSLLTALNKADEEIRRLEIP